MKKYAEEAKTWTFENLSAFLHDPKGVVPGTKMAFPGLKDDKERANVLAYLRDAFRQPRAASCRAPRRRRRHADRVRRSGAPATDAGTAPPAERRLAGAEPAAAAEQSRRQTAPAETPPAPAESQAPAPQPAPEQQTAAATPCSRTCAR